MARRTSTVAIIAAFNEADIIASVVSDLVDQGILVYLIDDQSSDATTDAVAPLLGRGLLGIEQFSGGTADTFRWAELLERKAQLAMELPGDWFIHHDADEFRSSPWPGILLGDAIDRVDHLGYNAIDFERLDFWPVLGEPDRIGEARDVLTAYARPQIYDRQQIRCWKRGTTKVDLVSSGGHDVQFPDRRVFPIRFSLRHYPVRGQAHGERKVWSERLPRFDASEKARGWHVQYKHFTPGEAFGRPAQELTEYDSIEHSISLNLRHRIVEELEEQVTELLGSVCGLGKDVNMLLNERAEVVSERTELTQARAVLEENLALVSAARDQAQHDVVRLQNALRDRDGSVQELTSQLQTRELAFAKVVARADGLQASLENGQRLYSRLMAEVTDIRRSRSWRWTAPVRWLLGPHI